MAETATVEIQMPQMGESVTEGIVLEWHKREGDFVEEGDTVVEVSTDKVDAEVPAPASGTISEVLKAEDETVQVGEALARLEPGGEPSGDGAAARQDAGQKEGEKSAPEGADAPVPTAAEEEAAPAAAEGPGEGEAVELLMPEMGESVTEGVILEWHKAEGDTVEQGETVVEVSTDKVDAEVPAPAAGTVTKLLKQQDETVQVGEALAEIAASGAAASATPDREQPSAPGAEEAPARGPAAADAGDGARSSPVARRVAADRGIDLANVRGTGIGGRITKADVLAAADGGDGATAPAAPLEAEVNQLRGPAAMLAKAMDESLATPTATSFRTLPVDTLDAKRRGLNGALKERGMKVSFTHLIAWAMVQAATEWAVMTRTFAERDGKPHAVQPGHVNLGIAVDVERRDGSRGLMVPCIKSAEGRDFAGFHGYYEELITKTRENKLTADDFQGTNITLTNPGGLGTVASVPRLTSGGTIIATGSIAYPVEWQHAPKDKLEALGVSKVMTMTSTYDHRVIQGAESGSFLRRVDELLQGEDGFYESVAESLGVDPEAVASAHAASASAPPIAPPAAEAPTTVEEPSEELLQAVQAATSLLKAFRTHGHLAAHLDPLGSEPKGDPALEPENLNLTPELMKQIPASILRVECPGNTLLDLLPKLQEAYCGTIGYQVEHLSSHQQRMWLRDRIESGWHRQPLEPEQKRALLERLAEVFQFERFIQKAYLGQKTFSIEGLDAVVPMIDEAASLAERAGANQVVLGMAHRGRLSVLTHNLNRSVESILAEFEGAKEIESVKAVAAIPHHGTGDVKYHHGAEGALKTGSGEEIRMRLYPNPSHLEFVDPVATGAAREAQTDHSGPRLEHDPSLALPLLLHGDAAFPAQGVVAETLNLLALDGYATGGTVHVITNNQVGFTTDPYEARSTPYASDVAKGYNVPIMHVNADDVEACIAAVRLAMAYREEFRRDVVIDLIGYRRYGHNETDEPAYTQPKMATTIKKHPPVSEIYAEKLVSEGVVSADDVEADAKRRREDLSAALKQLRAKIEAGELQEPATGTATRELDRRKSPEVDTAVPAQELEALNEQLLEVPDSFTIHRKLRKPLSRRRDALTEGGIDFGHAEALAFASLLAGGTHLRLTGQDTERGTFSHRHLVLHDEKTGLKYAPIQHLNGAKAPFEIHNSPLSETGCLGFEYGYAAASPDSLILWEAQFGDFANAGQVIIDSFIASGESKWGQTTRLTLLLPHGYEGSGPEHSSARIERFIALAAEGNMRLANPTTAAQYFHLLRRQALIEKPRPLVVLTPKGLLRLAEASSRLEDLTEGRFQFVLDDPRSEDRREAVERLVLCSGKVYYDIDGQEKRAGAERVAIARLELLYPFAKEQLAELIGRYPNLKEIVWVQEEPQNKGAWKIMSRRLPELIPDGVEFGYIGRPQRAAPSEGYPAAHRTEQERIVLTALEGASRPAFGAPA